MIVSLLEAEHPDVESLADEVIISLKAKWLEADIWTVNMYDPNTRVVVTFGPYLTQNQAQRGLKELASPGPLPAQGWISRLREMPS